MRFENLLFDGDDTLFDFPKAALHAFHSLCRAQQLPDTPEHRACFNHISAALWEAFDRGEVSKEFATRERFVRFLAELGLRRNPDECNRDYLAALGEGVYPLPHAEEVCAELSKTRRLYIITNAVASVHRSRLQNSVFAPYITASILSEEAGASKPDPAYFAYALSGIPGATKENCLVVGDSPSADMAGANQAGLPCCWYNPVGKPRPAGLRIDWEIRDLLELYEIV